MPTIDIDENSSLPFWVQIRDRFVFLINSGYYSPGDQLPSVRKLAAESRISYNTVSKAYMALEREGYIYTAHGSGAYVNEADSTTIVSEIEVITEEFVKSCLEKGVEYEEIPKCVNKAIRKLRRENEKK